MIKRLKSLRTERLLSQEELARALSVTETTVNRWERTGCIPRLAKLREITEFFGVPLRELLAPDELARLQGLEPPG